MLKADGFDAAVIGIGERCGQPNIIVYNVKKCIDILMKRDRMGSEEAEEYFSYNVLGAYVGELTPMFVHTATIEEIDDDFSQ